MNFVKYRREDYDRLRPLAERLGPDVALSHRPFVDYFYATQDDSSMYLFTSNDGSVGGILGLERLHFECIGRELVVGSPTNYYSFHSGAGGYLFLHWMKMFKVGMVFGGSADTHRILREQKWTYYPGVKVYLLNRAYRRSGTPAWKSAAHWALERTRPRLSRFARRIRRATPAALEVREEKSYTDDLLPRRSAFTFRLAPRAEYLSWRYNMQLPFVRYRLFRILRGGTNVGYVILNEQPDRLLVAHCDGEDPVELAYGVALGVMAATCADQHPREVILTCCHAAMQTVFKALGFRESRHDRPFVLGSLRHQNLLPPVDTSNWLINFDLGDNGLRPPFLDQVPQ